MINTFIFGQETGLLFLKDTIEKLDISTVTHRKRADINRLSTSHVDNQNLFSLMYYINCNMNPYGLPLNVIHSQNTMINSNLIKLLTYQR